MATPNVGILTNSGKNLIDQVNAGQTKITFSKIVFSSMDNSQLSDDQIKALTAITPQEVVVNSPEATLDANTGETRIRATGNNKALSDGVYVKTYAVYAKDDSGNEILYGLTVSPNPNYLPEYDGVTPQVVTYSYKVNISNTSNITFSNSDDIYVSDTDLTEALQPYAKTVDVNQQLDKKVNVADMRKPASDVAGIEEVNTKVTDNKDGTEQLNGVQVQPFNKLSDTIGGRNLLIGTSDFTGWTLSGSTAQGTTDGLTYAHLFVDNSAVAPNFTLAESTTYTVSFDALGYSAGTTQIYIGYSEDSNGNIIASDYANATLNALDGASVRVSLTFTTPSSFTKTNFNIGCGRAYNTGGSVYIRHVKLEKGSIATDWTPAPEDKVNVADMRKSASDVAGIEEVNTKVTDNHDGTITANGTIFSLLKSLSASSIPQDPTRDYNTLPQGLALMSETNGEPANMPPVKSTYLTLTIASNFATGRKRQLAWLDAGANSSNNNYTYIRYCVGSTWSSWDSIPTSTQISSLIPSTLADTTKLANFQAGLQSGGVSVATSDDLKSVENSAWHQLDSSLITFGNRVSVADTLCLYRIDLVNKRIYISWTTIINSYYRDDNPTVSLNFSGIVSKFINKGSGKIISGVTESDLYISGSNISYQIPTNASNLLSSGDHNDCWFGYDTLLI
ncbi:hypothetical protein FAM21838_02037 [Lentilactobacillus parabuchneri]|uniref:hypothetical protein n=1 Tax=Lentilactobacillus parabuchneri TaxID=152331 RepID=UPI000A103D75|nr:hypothetical protein [Lentilactobacillus parabuchneri]ORN08235.1 hypothetical protein FAM21838_02037 [Lentilactobacillus parabuchneri]